MNIETARERFVEWLALRMTHAGRGDKDEVLNVEPAGKYWLGRLQSAEAVAENGWGDRGERLEPCAIGIKVKSSIDGPWLLKANISLRVWLWDKKVEEWHKSSAVTATVSAKVDVGSGKQIICADEIEQAIRESAGATGLSGRVEVEVETGEDGKYELTICFVNTSPKSDDHFRDTRFYECELRVDDFPYEPFILESLEDSFRYDRRVAAYGINCGVKVEGRSLVTEDAITVDRNRPVYWSSEEEQPALTFQALSVDPCIAAKKLLAALESWGEENWSNEALSKRKMSEQWSEAMAEKAAEASKEFAEEVLRIRRGIAFLEDSPKLLSAFKCMNKAMSISANGKYDSWRPFQFGFLLANIASVVNYEEEAEIADVVWFATGGGKTETYLGLIITAAFYDRLTGKLSGMTAWSRFPLRMLSLQQTQRFADALAAAEIVRQEAGIEGDEFSLGFFVGQGATPNKIPEEPKEGEPDPDDDTMPERYRTLDYCPFCRADSIKMVFDRRHWRLAHCCANGECTWGRRPLPVYIVDEEVYRFLPTVVVGTLDKAASISLQASMRGLVGAPLGKCPQPGHGYTYMPRSARPKGCLVPGCQKSPESLTMSPERYGPTFRLQDELHLLRDSLGAVDSHYEALYDDLQQTLCGRKPKILASSATLTGYEKQVDVLYRRKARVFPVPPPRSGGGFWTSDSEKLMRKFLAVAPRGVTIEYTVDRLLTELQRAIRDLVADPMKICAEVDIDPKYADDLISNYGTNVVYGNTLRDLEAVVRSLETQVQVEGEINTASLTGKTDFHDVRTTLNRLQSPEADFQQRLHIVSASSMMSHGVDVDRLNIMVMLGLPLSAAEFIQATARVGRRYPSLVFVIHKIGRERDAGVFRAFPEFIRQGDRFVDPIPITKRSRRVLEKTIAGLELARIRVLHETLGSPPLTTVKALRDYAKSGKFDLGLELKSIIGMLKLEDELDEVLVKDIHGWFERFENNIESPPPDAKFVSDLSPTGDPMLSLRDVEKQVPVVGTRVEGR